jgi:hypothetical protein
MMNEARRRSQYSRTSLRFVSLLPQMKQNPRTSTGGADKTAGMALGAVGALAHPKSSDSLGYPDSKIKQIVILRRSRAIPNDSDR